MSNGIDMNTLRKTNKTDIDNLMEVKQRELFRTQLINGLKLDQTKVDKLRESGMKDAELRTIIEAGIATFLLHVEARIASSVGQGFYTIGPCGEEIMAAVALNLSNTDPSALHYRHVAMSVTRQLRLGKPLNEILLDRARGFTCSTLDPVTGGRHCAIGGTPFDFMVTSTLASQCPPAVGRALAISLSHHLAAKTNNLNANEKAYVPVFPKNAVSFVSIGEGSANNAHFLAAINLAEYSQYHKRKVIILLNLLFYLPLILLILTYDFYYFIVSCCILHYR
jgi:TPP-dependent pyruvate/acetoin dehydrogenase alpha subunit